MTTPRLVNSQGFLWHVEYDDNDYSPGTQQFVRGWTFGHAYRRAFKEAPKRAPQYRQLHPWRMQRVTPLTVRYWEMRA